MLTITNNLASARGLEVTCNVVSPFTVQRSASRPLRRAKDISEAREMLSNCPEGTPDRGRALIHLGFVLNHAYKVSGDPMRLRDAIMFLNEAQSLHALDHPLRSTSLIHLSSALLDDYLRDTNTNSLDRAILLQREALSLHPPGTGSPLYQISLVHLANGLREHFLYHGDLSSLDESIVLFRRALLQSEATIAHSFQLYHGSRRQASDLSAATPQSPHDSEIILSMPIYDIAVLALATSLIEHWEWYGESDSLHEAISIFRDVVEKIPARDYTWFSAISHLANGLVRSYRSPYGTIAHLDEGIALYRKVLAVCDERYHRRPNMLTDLANALMHRYEYSSEDPNDDNDSRLLEEAIAFTEEALSLHTVNHTHRGLCMLHLHRGYLLSFKHKVLGHSIIHEMNDALQKAEICLPFGTALRQEVLWRLSEHKMKANTPFYNISESIDRLSEAISYPFGIMWGRLSRARSALECLERMLLSPTCSISPKDHISLLKAYENAIRLMPRVAILGLPPRKRRSALDGSQEIATAAAVRALNLGQVTRGVELLEQGRAVFWSQALRLRTSFDKLPGKYATALRSLARALEKGAISHELSLSQPVLGKIAEEWALRRKQNEEFDELLKEIRQIQGFEHFLLHEQYSSLNKAAVSGPVIILIDGLSQSHALIVRQDEPPLGILLPEIGQVCLTPHPSYHAGYPRLSVKSGSHFLFDLPSIQQVCSSRCRELASHAPYQKYMLEQLWENVIYPIIQALQLNVRMIDIRPTCAQIIRSPEMRRP
jgi:tetratricopeptide (TPR) repeat protein